MMSRGLFHLGKLPAHSTLINMDPGTVNTKMLLAGWGACGIEVEEASDTFRLATEDQFENPAALPQYYVSLRPRNPTKQAQ